MTIDSQCTPLSRKTFFFLLFFALALYSCSIPKSTAYFQTIDKDTTISGVTQNTLETKIKHKDILSINISSLSPAEDAFFNSSSAQLLSESSLASSPGYFVDEQGTILMHKVGRIKVDGLTRRELQSKLQKELAPYLKDPIVTVSYLNHRVTVFGGVGTPQIINMPEEQMSIIDVIVKSGDISADAQRDKVMIIRDNGTEKIVKHINMKDHSIFTSPWFYLQSNDIVYIAPDFSEKNKEQKRAVIQRNIGFITAGVSFLALIISTVTR